MKKVLMFAIFTIFLVGLVFAVPSAPSPTCKINAQIINVSFQEAHSCPYFPTDYYPEERIVPAKYLLNVKITAVSTVENGECYETTPGNSNCEGTCESLYPLNSEQTLTIYKSQIKSAYTFNEEDILEGNIHFSGDECNSGIWLLSGYSTSHIEPVEDDNQSCVEKDGACCIGDICNTAQLNCIIGTTPKCEGCDNNCEQKCECKKVNETGCEAWSCTKWGACLNEIKTRTCTKVSFNCTDDNEKPKLTKDCHEKEKLNLRGKLRDCPEECVCSGSTIKCTFENGTKIMTIYAGKSGNVIVQIKNINMSTNVTLYKNEEGKVYGVFKGNKTYELILPDEIKEKLQNNTRAKLYNESMNLTDDGYYKIEGKKKARLFWLIPVREHMEAQVDAETGEAIKIRNPWWGFLARDVKEDTNSED